MVEISALLNRQIPYNNEVPILNRDDIDRISAEILRNYMPNVLASPMPINVEALIEKHFNLRLNFQSFSPDGSILGETIFADGYRAIFSLDEDSGFFQKQCISVKRGMIFLDSAMVEQAETRTAFTEAHELGHWILHGSFYGSCEKRACRSFLKQRLYFPHRTVMTPVQWTEWQANTFAAALLLPKDALRITLQNFLEDIKLDWKSLSDFSQYENRISYDKFLHIVAKTYMVSVETARLRMNKLCRISYPN